MYVLEPNRRIPPLMGAGFGAVDMSGFAKVGALLAAGAFGMLILSRTKTGKKMLRGARHRRKLRGFHPVRNLFR